MTVEELQVVVSAQTRGIQEQMQSVARQMQNIQRRTNTMSTSMTRTFTNLKRTLVGLGIGKAIQSMFNLSRTYEAATMQVNRIFKENASAIEAWIQKNATTFGMARADAMQYASIYGNLVKGFEKDTSKMSQYTTQLLEATTVIASNTGRTVKDVSERIRSGILGNTEAIEDLGIYAQVSMVKTSNAFKTIANGRSWDKLTFQEQQQIRVMSILEQSASQFGTSIQQNMNYKLMQLTANLKNVALNLGNAFAPIVNAILPALNAMALALANVTNRMATFMNTLFGTNFGSGAGSVEQVGVGASNAASGYEDMANSADAAGESAENAAKKAKNALMGFDEINSLSKDSGSGSSDSGSGTGASDVGVVTSNAMSEAAESFADKLKSEMDKLKNLFKQGFEIGLGDGWKAQIEDIKQSIHGIKESLKDIFTDGDVLASLHGFLDIMAISLGKEVGSLASIGTTMAQNLLGGVNKYLEQNNEYIKERIIGILDARAEVEVLVSDYMVALSDIFSVFGGETGQQITANIIGIFSNGLLGAVEVVTKLGRDLIGAFTTPIIENKELIKTTLEATLKPIQSITGSIKDFITNTFISINESYNAYVAPAFQNINTTLTNLMTNLLNNYNTYILPVIDGIASKVSDLFTTYIQPNVDLIIEAIGRIINAGSKILNEVIEPMIEDLNNLLGPAIGFVIEKVSDFAIALTGELFEALGNISDKIADVCEWFAEHKTATEVIITTLGSFAAAIGIVKLAMNAGAIAQAAITVATTAWNVAAGIGATVTGAFGAAMAVLTSPITLVVAAIAAVIATVVLLVRHWDEVKEVAAKCWEGIKEAWNKAGEWFNTTVVQPISKFFTGLWDGIKQTASSAWTGLKNTWNGAKQWFSSTVIDPIARAFDTMWNGIKSTCSNVFNSIRTIVKAPMNFVIDCINNVIGGVNKVTSAVNTVPGVDIGHIKEIPKLARGGIINTPTIAQIGEAGPEAVVPLENTGFVRAIGDAVSTAVGNAMMSALQFSNSGHSGMNEGKIILEIDGREFARAIIPDLKKEVRRTGVSLSY